MVCTVKLLKDDVTRDIDTSLQATESPDGQPVSAGLSVSPCATTGERSAIREAATSLRERGIDCVAEEPMSRHTTYRLGGPAALMVVPNTPEGLVETLAILAVHEVPVIVVGGGSNLLVADEGVCAAVIKLGHGFRQLEVDGTRITAGGACSLAQVAAAARNHGLTGLEFAAGIPGTVGGAVAMNAGSRDRWMNSIVRTVTTVSLPGVDGGAPPALDRRTGSSITWGYRSTDLRDRAVICEVTLDLAHGSADDIARVIGAAAARRRDTQPIGQPNAGSVFKNPPNDSAGRLIEAAGLKGFSIGGAVVSPVHANFIVAGAGATATDVYELVGFVRGKVVADFGVELSPEIRFVGRF